MLHHAFKKLASYSLSHLMFCASVYRSVPLFKCKNSSLIYDVSDVNTIIISSNSTRDHEFNKQWLVCKYCSMWHTAQQPHDCIWSKYLIQHIAQSIVTYVLPTCFDLCKVIISEVHTKAYKYSKFCQKCACTELKPYILLIKIINNV